MKAVYRTAPATPGLVNITGSIKDNIQKNIVTANPK